MRETVNLTVQMRDTIEQEISQRTGHHQQAVRKLQTAAGAVQPGSSGSTRKPLVMLAHGDSWFDYPLSGNNVSLDGSTDIIAHLSAMGDVKPIILNVSHFADATSEELSLPKQQRMIETLQDPRNWLKSGKPDAILYSGGGDDIAGNQFCIFLDYSSPSAAGLNMTALSRRVGRRRGIVSRPVRFPRPLRARSANLWPLLRFSDSQRNPSPVCGSVARALAPVLRLERGRRKGNRAASAAGVQGHARPPGRRHRE